MTIALHTAQQKSQATSSIAAIIVISLAKLFLFPIE